MSLYGLVARSYARMRSIGIRRFFALVWDRYARRLLLQSTMGRQTRIYVIGDKLLLAAPAYGSRDLDALFDICRQLEQRSDLARNVRVRIGLLDPSTTAAYSDIPHLSTPITVDRVATTRMVLGFVMAGGDALVPDGINPVHREEIVTACRHLGINVLRSVDDIAARLQQRHVIRLEGRVATTEYLYSLLRDRVEAGYYGYTERLDESIVAELPRKFDIINGSAEVRCIPFRDLYKYPGRISRQYAVADLYRDYLSGASVLDIGCDLKGIGDRLPAATRYVGVDMQGLADYKLDLDREPLPFGDREFDSVVCFETLEHLRDIHGVFDKVLDIANRHCVASLYIESGANRGRSVDRYGLPLGTMHLPLAPVYDRHQWVFSFGDALDFVYYRARRKNFRIRRLDLFYDDLRVVPLQRSRIMRALRRGNVGFLARNVTLIGFVLEREASAVRRE